MGTVLQDSSGNLEMCSPQLASHCLDTGSTSWGAGWTMAITPGSPMAPSVQHKPPPQAGLSKGPTRRCSPCGGLPTLLLTVFSNKPTYRHFFFVCVRIPLTSFKVYNHLYAQELCFIFIFFLIVSNHVIYIAS